MKQRTCKHCKQIFNIEDKPKGWMANHSRWCTYNPKRQDYINALSSDGNTDRVALMNVAKKKSGVTNQYTKARLSGNEIPPGPWKDKTGPFKDKTHTIESKEKIRRKSLLSKHRRLRKNTVEYKGVILDSSWELALAKRLDELGVKWVRPEPLEWIDSEGLKHNYFPDFYLTEYDVYIDPKNPHAIQVQQNKLKVILNQYKNILILDTLQKCNEFTTTTLLEFPE